MDMAIYIMELPCSATELFQYDLSQRETHATRVSLPR